MLIGLSAACVVHCLATPLLIVLLPSLSALPLENEALHSWLLVVVIPSSLVSLLMGCKQHQFYRVLVIGFCGLLLLMSAVLVEGFQYGEILEKVLTVLGASVLAAGHYLNFRKCQSHNDCHCQDEL